MNLLDEVLSAQGGGAVRQLSQRFGLGEDQTVAAISSLLPALAGGLRQNVSTGDGASSLLAALAGGGHQKYVGDPEILGQEETTRDGNGILGHLLGSKDVSRQVARQAAESTGVGESILKQMLPVVATMVMGYLSKQTAGAQGGGATSPSGLIAMLGPLLGSRQGASPADGLAGMLGGLFKT